MDNPYPNEAEAKRAFWRWIKKQGQSYFFGMPSIWKKGDGYYFSLDRRSHHNSRYALTSGYQFVSVWRNRKWDHEG